MRRIRRWIGTIALSGLLAVAAAAPALAGPDRGGLHGNSWSGEGVHGNSWSGDGLEGNEWSGPGTAGQNQGDGGGGGSTFGNSWSYDPAD